MNSYANARCDDFWQWLWWRFFVINFAEAFSVESNFRAPRGLFHLGDDFSHTGADLIFSNSVFRLGCYFSKPRLKYSQFVVDLFWLENDFNWLGTTLSGSSGTFNSPPHTFHGNHWSIIGRDVVMFLRGNYSQPDYDFHLLGWTITFLNFHFPSNRLIPASHYKIKCSPSNKKLNWADQQPFWSGDVFSHLGHNFFRIRGVFLGVMFFTICGFGFYKALFPVL